MDNPKTIYSKKAEKYARYRWRYAPEAVEALFATAGLDEHATIADIGAGTGILTRPLLEYGCKVYAVEPNDAMRAILARDLAGFVDAGRLTVSDAFAEQIPLPDASVDLVTVAQAIHWCQPEPTRAEFRRILKPGGWLALLRNFDTQDTPFDQAIRPLLSEENGVVQAWRAQPPHPTPYTFFYDPARPPQPRTYPFQNQQDFAGFFGALCSASFMPDEDHPRFAFLERAARTLFEQYYPGGWMAVRGETELIIGLMQDDSMGEA